MVNLVCFQCTDEKFADHIMDKFFDSDYKVTKEKIAEGRFVVAVLLHSEYDTRDVCNTVCDAVES